MIEIRYFMLTDNGDVTGEDEDVVKGGRSDLIDEPSTFDDQKHLL